MRLSYRGAVMNRKLVVLLAVALAVIFTFLIAQFGSNPFSTKDIQATYLKLSSDELTFKEDNGQVIIVYYLPYLEENETKAINLKDFVDLDPEASNDKSTLKYTIIFENESDADKLDVVESGPLGGRLTISGQAVAVVTISTTDGSGLSCQLFIRPNKTGSGEHIGGDIFD